LKGERVYENGAEKRHMFDVSYRDQHPDSFHDLKAVDWQTDKPFPGQPGEQRAD
jgi:hypothetical protein